MTFSFLVGKRGIKSDPEVNWVSCILYGLPIPLNLQLAVGVPILEVEDADLGLRGICAEVVRCVVRDETIQGR